MQGTLNRSLRGWRAGILLAIGVAVGLVIAAGPAASRGLWGAHRLKPDTQPRAYAFVRPSANGTFGGGRSRGFAAVRHATTGVYCFAPQSGVELADRAATASPEWTYSMGDRADIGVFVAFATSPCTADELGVITTRAGSTTDDVAFTVVVS